MAKFMAWQQGDFIVLTYKKKETKNKIDNSSHGLMGLGTLLITFVLATILCPVGWQPLQTSGLWPSSTLLDAVRRTPHAARSFWFRFDDRRCVQIWLDYKFFN
jgi:hypothetical protein